MTSTTRDSSEVLRFACNNSAAIARAPHRRHQCLTCLDTGTVPSQTVLGVRLPCPACAPGATLPALEAACPVCLGAGLLPSMVAPGAVSPCPRCDATLDARPVADCTDGRRASDRNADQVTAAAFVGAAVGMALCLLVVGIFRVFG